MDELLESFESADLVELLLDIVFHSLHIVVGGLLDLLHAGSTLLVEMAIDIAQTWEEVGGECCQLGLFSVYYAPHFNFTVFFIFLQYLPNLHSLLDIYTFFAQ